MRPLTPAVKLILVINVVVFALINFNVLSSNLLGLHSVHADQFYLFQIITSFFTHKDLMHILFNMFMLYSLGTMLESYWGNKRFLNFYLICGLGGSLLHMGVHEMQFRFGSPLPPMAIGASGAVFGVFTAIARLFPNTEFMLFLIPFPIKAKYLWAIMVLVDLFMGIMSFQSDNIGRWAHLGGVLTALILLQFYKKNRNRFY